MDIKDTILNRRSVRQFRDSLVSKDLLIDILDVARWAPTHCNTQKVKFIIVTDKEIRKKIVDLGSSKVIKNSKQGILVLYDSRSDNVEYKDHIQSGAAIIQTFCLYAHSKDIGTCWVCHLPKKRDLRKLFKIPKYYDPIAYIALGSVLKVPCPVPRKYKIKEIVSLNKFDFKEEKVKSIFFRKIARKIYYSLPLFIKKIINPSVDKYLVKKFKN